MKKPDYSLKNLDPFNTSFLLALPTLGILFLLAHIYIEGFNPYLLIAAFAMYALTTFSISGGYHRLFSHRAYKANKFVKLFYLIFGAASGQTSALRWASNHRIHHRNVDTDQDPYNIHKGFFFAHIGWVMLKDSEDFEEVFAKDLMRDPLVMWQHKYATSIALISNTVICLFIGWLTGSYLGSIAIVGFLRLTLVHHITFSINSFAHMIGSRPYNKKQTARDSHLLALVTFGEGYHNFHHTFESDFRNGFNWYEWDPTKWILSVTTKLGLTYDLIRTPTAVVERIKYEANQNVTSLHQGREKVANR
jgi:stearoyl-CoA desaturase (delta-9 desaturase)